MNCFLKILAILSTKDCFSDLPFSLSFSLHYKQITAAIGKWDDGKYF
jgi:hypothetical protein